MSGAGSMNIMVPMMIGRVPSGVGILVASLAKLLVGITNLPIGHGEEEEMIHPLHLRGMVQIPMIGIRISLVRVVTVA